MTTTMLQNVSKHKSPLKCDKLRLFNTFPESRDNDTFCDVFVS